MEKIDQKYSIGIEEMDIQHAHWIKLIEEFKATASGHLLDQTGIEAAEVALQKLLSYTKSHFASEEHFIAAKKYPALEQHRKRHRELEQEITKLLGEIQAHKQKRTPLKLHLLVTIWLMEHIMQEDDDYARFILGKPQRQKNHH